MLPRLLPPRPALLLVYLLATCNPSPHTLSCTHTHTHAQAWLAGNPPQMVNQIVDLSIATGESAGRRGRALHTTHTATTHTPRPLSS